MRVLVIALAGLSTLAAGWMLIRDPGPGTRNPGTFPSRSTSRAELDATIE